MRLTNVLLCVSLGLSAAGCPESKSDRLAQLRAAREAEKAARKAHREERLKARNHDWPPKLGETYPDLLLFDAEGKEVRLSSLAGKSVLLHLGAMCSPGTVAYTGGNKAEPFAGCAPQQDALALEAWLKRKGISAEHPELRIVHALFYGTNQSDPPSAEDLRKWIAHFGLAERPNTIALRGDMAYSEQATFERIPGVQLIGPDRKFLVDCARNTTTDWNDVIKALKTLQRKVVPAPLEPLPDPFADLRARLQQLLLGKDFVELEAELERQAKRGRREGRLRTWFEEADHLVYTQPGGELLAPEHLDAWVHARPDSWLASYVRGLYRIRAGWNARGNGLADTVSEEGWRVFREQLTLAHGDLERAHEIHPDQPYAATALLTVARARSLQPPQMQSYFEAATSADPSYLPAYELALEYLKAKWHGSDEIAYGFVKAVREDRQDDPAMAALTLNHHDEMMRAMRDKRSYLRHPEVKQEIDAARALLTKHFPQAEWVRETLLRMSFVAEQPDFELAKALAEDGNGYANYCLGMAYRNGKGLPRDYDQGIRYLLRAAAEGYEHALPKVAHALLYHPAFRHEPKRALSWLQRSAAKGNTWSHGVLARFYRDGEAVKQDVVAAAAGFRIARRDYDWARKELIKLLEEHPQLREPGDPR